MNATTFTTAFLREIIPSLIFTNKAVTVSTSYCNQSLVEFSKELEIEINSAEKENDLIKINFLSIMMKHQKVLVMEKVLIMKC